MDKKMKSTTIFLNILKISLTIVFIISTIFIIVYAVDAHNTDIKNNNLNNENLLVFFTFMILLFGLITYSLLFSLSVLGLVISIVYKTLKKRKSQIIYFSILALSVISTYLIIFFVVYTYL